MVAAHGTAPLEIPFEYNGQSTKIVVQSQQPVAHGGTSWVIRGTMTGHASDQPAMVALKCYYRALDQTHQDVRRVLFHTYGPLNVMIL